MQLWNSLCRTGLQMLVSGHVNARNRMLVLCVQLPSTAHWETNFPLRYLSVIY